MIEKHKREDTLLRVLVVTSFYSALDKSIKTDEWKPEGMPAVAKLFDGFKQQGVCFDNVMIDRRSNNKTVVRKYNNSYFNNTFYAASISGTNAFFKCPPIENIRSLFVEILYFNVVRKFLNTCKYDVVYIDRSNTVIAWFVSLFCDIPVFLRYHGIVCLREIFSKLKNKLLHPLRYISLFGNYAYILCSLDGSPAKSFLDKFRRKNVKFGIMLNGVDEIELPNEEQKRMLLKELGLGKDVPILLFTGRLVEDKGIGSFLETIKILHGNSKPFHVIIIGDGDLKKWAENFINDNQLGSVVTLLGQVDHDRMLLYLGISDVYTSLNQLGNLSNTVLEALSAGLATIVLKNREQYGEDMAMNILGESVFYIDRNNTIEELKNTINNLIVNPKLITEYKNRAKMLAGKSLVTWDERIAQEIELIRKAANFNKKQNRRQTIS